MLPNLFNCEVQELLFVSLHCDQDLPAIFYGLVSDLNLHLLGEN